MYLEPAVHIAKYNLLKTDSITYTLTLTEPQVVFSGLEIDLLKLRKDVQKDIYHSGRY